MATTSWESLCLMYSGVYDYEEVEIDAGEFD
jgi:hypothetical protein